MHELDHGLYFGSFPGPESGPYRTIFKSLTELGVWPSGQTTTRIMTCILSEIILPYYCRYRAYAKDYDVIGAFSIPNGTGGTSYSLGND